MVILQLIPVAYLVPDPPSPKSPRTVLRLDVPLRILTLSCGFLFSYRMERDQCAIVLRSHPHSRHRFEGRYGQLGRFGWDWDRAVHCSAARDRIYRYSRAKGVIKRSVFLFQLTLPYGRVCSRPFFLVSGS